MKELVCKMCNSNEIVKQDDLFVCESCGTKYTTEEAEKLSVEVVLKNDNAEKIEALLRAAKRAREMSNQEAAAKYYEEILGLDPDRWEAVFYSAYCTAASCKIAQIASAARLVHNALEPTYKLIKENVPKEQQLSAATEVSAAASAIANMLAEAAWNHYYNIDNSISYKYKGEMQERTSWAALVAVDSGLYIDRIFGADCSAATVVSLTVGLRLSDIYGGIKTECVNNIINLLEKYSPEVIEKRKQRQANAIEQKKIQGFLFMVLAVVCAIIGFGVCESGTFFAIWTQLMAGFFAIMCIVRLVQGSKKVS